MIKVLNADCLEALNQFPPNHFDALVTDPPYHLTSIVKRFGANNASPAQFGTDGVFTQSSRGFMGKEWDGGDIAFRPETWAAFLRVLKPGAHLAAFAATKNSHRMVCAIEDAGFEIRDSLAWMYGSGFPKSHSDRPGRGSALKPAYEPICLARKHPSEKNVSANIQKWGVGDLDIDGCRVGGEPSPSVAMRASGKAPASCKPGSYGDGHAIQNRISPERWLEDRPGELLGRWPANVVHDGSAEVLECFPVVSSGKPGVMRKGRNDGACYGAESRPPGTPMTGYGDSGSATRFFYHAKASAHDRAGSKHPTIKPVNLMRWLVRMVCPPGGLLLDPFAGSGTTGAAAFLEGFDAVLIEKETEYFADIENRITGLL